MIHTLPDDKLKPVLDQLPGKVALLGVRPEDLGLADDGTSMKVTLVEELGADAYIYGEASTADGTSIPLIARAPGSTAVRMGDEIRVRATKAHVFQPDGERRRLSA